MKERILFECVGACGGNIGQLLHSRGYLTHFINASNDDLLAIRVKEELKYHIPNGKGCNKNMNKALFYARDYYKHMANVINNGFPRQDIIFFVFSLGGGTGAGISPILLEYLSSNNPNKHYGAIVVFPSKSESIKAQENSVIAYNKLISNPNLKAVFQLDNNLGDKFDVNIDFVEKFERLMDITIPDNRGVIDKAELEELVTCRGNIVMGDFNIEHGVRFDSGIFAPYKMGCKYMGISCKDDFNTRVLESVFGTPYDTYIGYNDESNFVVASGLPLYTSRVQELILESSCRNTERTQIIDNIDLKVPNMVQKVTKTAPKEEKTVQKVDFDDIFAKYFD